MCNHPIKIKNRTHFFHPQLSPLYRLVPCGKCSSCRAVKINEWFVRAFYQWQYYNKLGGTTLFTTLSYDEEHLPSYNGAPCFCKQHLQTFLHKLRVYLKRAGLPSAFTYFVVSEYGSKYERPHYHMLLFFPFRIIDSFKWHNFKADGFLDRAWIYGFNSFSKKHGPFVRCAAALRYCVKYLSKMDDIFSVHDRKELPKDFHSFHLQSKGFGLDMVNYISDDNLTSNKIYLPLTQIHNDDNYYSLPLYIKRKLLYSKVHDCLRLNDVGLTLAALRIDEQCNQIYNIFDSVLTSSLPISDNNHFAQYIGYESYLAFLSEVNNSDMKKHLYDYTTYYLYGRFTISETNVIHAPHIITKYIDNLRFSKYSENLSLEDSNVVHELSKKLLTDSFTRPSATLFCHIIDCVKTYCRLYAVDAKEYKTWLKDIIKNRYKNNLPKCL